MIERNNIEQIASTDYDLWTEVDLLGELILNIILL